MLNAEQQLHISSEVQKLLRRMNDHDYPIAEEVEFTLVVRYANPFNTHTTEIHNLLRMDHITSKEASDGARN